MTPTERRRSPQVAWRRRALAAATLLGAIALLVPSAPGAAAADGKRVFVEQKCGSCHKAPGVEGRGSDLSKVGARRNADWLRAYLLREKDRDGRKHAVEYKGSTTDLDALVAWLASLK